MQAKMAVAILKYLITTLLIFSPNNFIMYATAKNLIPLPKIEAIVKINRFRLNKPAEIVKTL